MKQRTYNPGFIVVLSCLRAYKMHILYIKDNRLPRMIGYSITYHEMGEGNH